MIELIKQLSLMDGVSGREQEVAKAIATRLEGKCQLHTDNLGNLIAFKKGKKTPKHKIMLAAHMDEVGFMINHIEDNGFLRFTTCGSIDPRVVVGRSVSVGKEKLHGVIGTKAIHMKTPEEREKTIEFDTLMIDIGAKDKEEAEKHVRIGDTATFHSDFVEYGEDFIRCKALDDRIGCALLIHLLEEFDEYDLHCAFTVQEETGAIGAKVAAASIQPDISLVLENTPAADIPGVSEDKQVCKLGDGPAIYFKDKGTIYDSILFNLLLDTGKEKGIPCQVKTVVSGMNDSRQIQISGAGVRVAAVAVPGRYLHSAGCVVKKCDIDSTLQLVKAVLPVLAEL